MIKKQNKITKMVVFLVTLAVSGMVLMACTGNDESATQGHVAVPEGDWREPFAEPVHITAVNTNSVSWMFEGDDDINNNPWTRLWADELNIHVTYNWTALDDFDTRLNMDIAANALPDVFHIPASMPRTFFQLVEEGLLLDLTDAYHNYASQQLRDFELTDPYTIQAYTINGRIFGIPRYYFGQIEQPWHLWIRKDWLEEAGSPEIRTVEDLENLARHFMATHGGYGISTSNTLEALFRTGPMFGAYIGDIHNNQYFWRPDETGRLRPGIAFPEFMVALEHWQRWFEEGILSPDFVTMDSMRAFEDVTNGIVGIQPFFQWWGWFLAPNMVALHGDDALMYPFHFPTLDGSRPARAQVSFPNMGVIVASADFENPAALMKILSMNAHMSFSPEANLTPEQRHYFFADMREHTMGATFSIVDPAADPVQLQYVQRALATGDSSELFTTGMHAKFNDSLSWINDRNPSGLGAYLQMGFPYAAYPRTQHLFNNGWYVRNAMWGPPPDEFDQAPNTGDIILEEVMQIIMGNQPVSHFYSVLEEWYARGGQIKEDAVNLHFNTQ